MKKKDRVKRIVVECEVDTIVVLTIDKLFKITESDGGYNINGEGFREFKNEGSDDIKRSVGVDGLNYEDDANMQASTRRQALEFIETQI